jgi:ABC-type lipoprotein release transport system permease subunit
MITLKQIGQEEKTIAALKPVLINAESQTWAQAFPELRSAIEMKSGVMQFFSLIILLIAESAC